MILDKEDHRKFLLELINTASFVGSIVEQIVELKESLINAKIEEKSDKKKTNLIPIGQK